MNDTDHDNDGITITAEGYTIHHSEKVSTGDYENANVSISLEGSIEGAEIDGGVPDAIRQRLLVALRDIQRDVERAAENRVTIRDHEQWSVYDK